MSERLWCTACGTVTRDQICVCNRWDDGNGLYREPSFVNYADAMQKNAYEAYQTLHKAKTCLRETDDFLNTLGIYPDNYIRLKISSVLE